MKQPNIIKCLVLYNVFISFALAITSNFTFIDRLLLRMNIDLALFGTIKSVIFLLPALLYQFVSPLFENKAQYTTLCIYSYLLRNIFPCILPFIILVTSDTAVLTVCSAVLLALGMTAATFANNYLMKIYRIAVPEEKFNYHVFSFYMLFSIPAFLAAYPLALILDKFDGSSDQTFFWVFALLQIATTLFEIPAIYYMRKVKTPQQEKNKTLRSTESSFKNILAPYKIPKFRTLLTMVSLHRLGMGLMHTYLTIYFLEVMKFSMSLIVLISTLIGITACLLMPCSGKVMDKFGYGKSFIFLAGCMLAGLLFFCSAWKAIWILPIFAVLLWNANDTVVPSILVQGEFAAAAKLTPPSLLNSAVSAYTIVNNSAIAVGMLAASFVYKIAQSVNSTSLDKTMHIYYLLSLPVFILLFYVTIHFKKVNNR